jgi:2-polyprenyl-3-methyl-5-hydroxy-6-metoxy-1,4-benzoquinol methylase
MSIGSEVLEFYKMLPFNYYGSLDEQVNSVLKSKPIEEQYRPLRGLMGPSKRILEIGCGAGWLTNSISYHYKKNVLGVDFNSLPLERAKAVATQLDLRSEFECEDLFEFSKGKNLEGEGLI